MKQVMTTLILVSSLSLSACVLAESPVTIDKSISELGLGEETYLNNCGICHNLGEMGTRILAKRLGDERAVLAERTDLAPAFINYVVRNGLLSMPLFNRGTLSEEELGAIVTYLTRHKTERVGVSNE